jgi:hypothetical protein
MLDDVKTREPVEHAGQAAPAWEHEWSDAAAADLADAADRRLPVVVGLFLVAAAAAAGLLPAIFPLSPGYPSDNTKAQVIAAALAAVAGVGIVPLAAAFARAVSRHGVILVGTALLSAGAAAIHFAVAKSHFDEYFLFGLFFVLSGIAQLAWAVLVLFRPSRLLLALGVVGNLLITAVWAVDRIWGLPIGPDPWKPESVGFADVTASAFEIVLALGCLVLFARPARAALRERRGLAFALTLAVTALTALGLLSAVGIGSPLITPSA